MSMTKLPGASKHVYYLFASNIITFALIGLSYIVYSQLLKPSEFGLYSIAITISNFGTMLLDGGLRNTIIKLPQDLKKEEEQVLIFLMICSSCLLSLFLIVGNSYSSQFFPNSSQDNTFIVIFAIIYLLSYPIVSMCTSQLERQFNYTNIAWIESVASIIEKAMPALIMSFSSQGVNSFILALFIGRGVRILCLLRYHAINISIPSLAQIRATLHLLREGAWLQSAMALSLVRDNMPVIVVGTLFGKTWLGYYTWALQLCSISSQIFAQIAVRVSLPLMAKAVGDREKLDSCLMQIKLLTIATAPILILVLFAIPSINHILFHDKWTIAINLLPLLFMRMTPGLATTPLGSMLMINKGGQNFAKANMLWTVVELMGAIIFSLSIGATGLAWSYGLLIWFGLLILILYLVKSGERLHLFSQIIESLFFRSSILTAGLLCLLLYSYTQLVNVDFINQPFLLLLLAPILALSYLSEKEFRSALRLKF